MNTAVHQQNSDLVWNLEKINQHKRAMNFVKQFENRFCVFSSSVRQLYTNYSIFFPYLYHTFLLDRLPYS